MMTRSMRASVASISLALAMLVGATVVAASDLEPSATFTCKGVVATIVGTNASEEIKGATSTRATMRNRTRRKT